MFIQITGDGFVSVIVGTTSSLSVICRESLFFLLQPIADMKKTRISCEKLKFVQSLPIVSYDRNVALKVEIK
jgi:hypothetical protein